MAGALVAYINLYGDVRDVCEGTNKKNDYQYYLDRGKKVGDMHGSGADPVVRQRAPCAEAKEALPALEALAKTA